MKKALYLIQFTLLRQDAPPGRAGSFTEFRLKYPELLIEKWIQSIQSRVRRVSRWIKSIHSYNGFEVACPHCGHFKDDSCDSLLH
jgi:hypothetical protein